MKSQISIVVYAIIFLVAVSCKKDDSKNIPIASFTVDPEKGYTSTEFMFDASSSTDEEDIMSSIQVRWDLDGDGNWDTKFSYNKDTSHFYNIAGFYDVKLEVRDADGWTNFTEMTITVLQDTTPPLTAFTINQTIIATNTVLID